MPRRPKTRSAAWVRGPALGRQLGLVRWLARVGRWVPTLELALATYGGGLSERRMLHRDLRALQRAGVPVEGDGGRWRLSRRAFAAWLGAL